MERAANQDASPDVTVAVMGATGTGKSTFINLLTNDAHIRIGGDPKSKTSEIQTARYVDETTGLSVMLIDTPDFDDSREGVTDTDILQKIADFLEPAQGERRKLDGIIYMHRISDPRLAGFSRRNLRMLRSLCGDDSLEHIRIVTTHWDRVKGKEGRDREEALCTGGFKSLLDAKARMRRHLNTVESARAIMSELISPKVATVQISQELPEERQPGDATTLSALIEEMRATQKKHEKELAKLQKEMEDVKNNLAIPVLLISL